MYGKETSKNTGPAGSVSHSAISGLSKGKTREREILDVSEKILATHGYSHLTAASIAKAIGITRPLLYHYFESAEAVATAVVRRRILEFERYLRHWIMSRDQLTVRQSVKDVVALIQEFAKCGVIFHRDAGDTGNAELMVRYVRGVLERDGESIVHGILSCYETALGKVPDRSNEAVGGGTGTTKGLGLRIGRETYRSYRPRTGDRPVAAESTTRLVGPTETMRFAEQSQSLGVRGPSARSGRSQSSVLSGLPAGTRDTVVRTLVIGLVMQQLEEGKLTERRLEEVVRAVLR